MACQLGALATRSAFLHPPPPSRIDFAAFRTLSKSQFCAQLCRNCVSTAAQLQDISVNVHIIIFSNFRLASLDNFAAPTACRPRHLPQGRQTDRPILRPAHKCIVQTRLQTNLSCSRGLCSVYLYSSPAEPLRVRLHSMFRFIVSILLSFDSFSFAIRWFHLHRVHRGDSSIFARTHHQKKLNTAATPFQKGMTRVDLLLSIKSHYLSIWAYKLFSLQFHFIYWFQLRNRRFS